MKTSAILSRDRKTLTVHVPMQFRRIGGRKQIITPSGEPPWIPARPQVNAVLIKALARAHRWGKQLDGGEHASIADLAISVGMELTYVRRILRLTLLSPAIVEIILNGKQPAGLTFEMLSRPAPIRWDLQHEWLQGLTNP